MVIWIFVTLGTDWSSVFYRKATIYKRRVDKETSTKRELSKSFTSATTSEQNYDSSSGRQHKSANWGVEFQ